MNIWKKLFSSKLKNTAPDLDVNNKEQTAFLSDKEFSALEKELLSIPDEIDEQKAWTRFPFTDARKKILKTLELTGSITLREPKKPLALIKPLTNFDEFIQMWNSINGEEAEFHIFLDNPKFDTDESFAHVLKFLLLEIMETKGFIVLNQDPSTGEVWGYVVYGN